MDSFLQMHFQVHCTASNAWMDCAKGKNVFWLATVKAKGLLQALQSNSVLTSSPPAAHSGWDDHPTCRWERKEDYHLHIQSEMIEYIQIWDEKLTGQAADWQKCHNSNRIGGPGGREKRVWWLVTSSWTLKIRVSALCTSKPIALSDRCKKNKVNLWEPTGQY